jgi:hypothetical protein
VDDGRWRERGLGKPSHFAQPERFPPWTANPDGTDLKTKSPISTGQQRICDSEVPDEDRIVCG